MNELTLDHLALLIDHRNGVITSLQAIGAKKLTRYLDMKVLGLMEDAHVNDNVQGIKITEFGRCMLQVMNDYIVQEIKARQ